MLEINFKRFENVVVAEVINLPELKGEERTWFNSGTAVRIGEIEVERITYGLTYLPHEGNHFANCGGIYICKNSQTKHICFDCRTETHAKEYIFKMQNLINKFNERVGKGETN